MASRLWRLLAAVTVLATLTGCAISGGNDTNGAQVVGGNADGLHGTELGDPLAVPETELERADNGEPYALTDGDADLRLVFFGYTHCPDICQQVMSSIASSMTRLSEEQRAHVDVVFVTTDPPRDTADVLDAYLARYDPAFIGLTAPMAKIREAAKPWGITFTKEDQLPSGGYEVTHTTRVYGITDQGANLSWDQQTSSAEFAEDIIAILEDQ